MISKPKPNIVKKKTKKTILSKNTALNEVLNNTNPLGSSGQTDEYPSLGGGVLGSDNMAEVLGYGNLGGVQNKEHGTRDGSSRYNQETRCFSRPSSRRCPKCFNS